MKVIFYFFHAIRCALPILHAYNAKLLQITLIPLQVKDFQDVRIGYLTGLLDNLFSIIHEQGFKRHYSQLLQAGTYKEMSQN
ncbi:MAG: hypothetical protein B6U76_05140 [Desulfurococcales archaeon ex4484_217_2]|nr:MAG: hypothetical protein B6U76_05140 [Desulfurococcales archaeon ex4484_217_2]